MKNLPPKVWVGRAVAMTFLGTIAAAFAILAHKLISNAEYHLAEREFNSIAKRAAENARQILLRKEEGVETVAEVLRDKFQYADQWPFIYMERFGDVSNHIIAASHGRNMALLPLVRPEEVSEFEDFAYSQFALHEEPGAGESSFGQGIYASDLALNNSDKRYHDYSGNTSWDSQYSILAPILQLDNDPSVAVYKMFNYYFSRTRGETIDRVIACSEQRALSGDMSARCGSLSNSYRYLAADENDYASAILVPVYPALNQTKLVGFIGSSLVWSDLLSDVFGTEDSGIDCVIQSESDPEDAYTYAITNGVISFKATGRQISSKYQKYQVKVQLTESNYFTDTSPTFTLTLYPSGSFFDKYLTANPRWAVTGTVLVILLTMLVFLCYDRLIREEFLENQVLLQAKRRFLRFISHAVRTPLSTVCMGLKLLQEELGSKLQAINLSQLAATTVAAANSFSSITAAKQTCAISISSSSQGDEGEGSEELHKITEWLQITQEILSSAQNAVDVINDLVNFDRLEDGNFDLDVTIIPIWQLIEKSCNEFQLQAEKSKIDLHLDFSQLMRERKTRKSNNAKTKSMRVGVRERKVVGDEARIAQVIRNVLSYALHTTPEGGAITVTAKWLEGKEAAMARGVCGVNSDDTSTSEDLEGGQQQHSSHSSIVPQSMTEFVLGNGEECAFFESGELQLTVTDSGPGMSVQQMEHLLVGRAPFTSDDEEQRHNDQFGLYIAKSILEEHDGLLQVYSLPTPTNATKATGVPPPVPTASTAESSTGSTLMLLLPLYHVPDSMLPRSLQHQRRGYLSNSSVRSTGSKYSRLESIIESDDERGLFDHEDVI